MVSGSGGKPRGPAYPGTANVSMDGILRLPGVPRPRLVGGRLAASSDRILDLRP